MYFIILGNRISPTLGQMVLFILLAFFLALFFVAHPLPFLGTFFLAYFLYGQPPPTPYHHPMIMARQ